MTRNEDADGYYSEHFAIQHGMLRSLSIHESHQDPIGQRLIIDIRGDKLPTWWKENKHKTKKARLVSISTGWHISLSLQNTSTHTHTLTQGLV